MAKNRSITYKISDQLYRVISGAQDALLLKRDEQHLNRVLGFPVTVNDFLTLLGVMQHLFRGFNYFKILVQGLKYFINKKYFQTGPSELQNPTLAFNTSDQY